VKDEAGGNADQVQVQVSGADSKGDKTDATGLYHVIASGDTFVMMFKKVGYLTAVTDEIASSESPIKVTEISLRRNEGKLEENVLYLQSQHKKIKSIKNAEIQRWAQGVFELQLKQVGEQHGLQLKDLTERIKTER
jgi:hypothetical protein